MIKTFMLDGVTGTIDTSGGTVWIQWGGISCHLSGLKKCPLKAAVVKALLRG